MSLPQQASVRIHEIYASIQGESSFVGLPCTFVRTSRCNLRCRWCDTPQAFVGGDKMSIDSILSEVAALTPKMVEVTGGEPLLQESTPELLKALCDAGYQVLLETSGERDIGIVDPRVHRIMDIKAPGSGEHEGNRWENIELLTKRDEVKFVLADEADYTWAKSIVDEHRLPQRTSVLLSPVFGELDPALLVDWSVRDGLDVRVQVQLHKYIWDADRQGV